MRIAIVTDAWFPQVNGVVRTLAATVAELDRRGYEVELITPDRFLTVPMPGYSSIRLAMAPRRTVRRTLDAFRPDSNASRARVTSRRLAPVLPAMMS